MSVSYTITVYSAAAVQSFEKEVVVAPGDPGTPDTYKYYLRFPTCCEEIKELYRDGEKVEVLGNSYIGYEVSKEEPSGWYCINPIGKSYQPCHIMCPIESSGGRGSYLNKRIMIPSAGIHAEPLTYHTIVDYYEGSNYIPDSTPPLELTIYPYTGGHDLTIHVKYCATEEEGEYDYDINLTYSSMEELVNNYVEVEFSGDAYSSLHKSFALY
jgi:hypothetical protein